MTDPRPLAADEIVVGCVTEDNPKFLGQALRLVQSIRWFGGELAGARIVVGAVDGIDPRARRAIEALGAEVRVVPRLEHGNPPSNRLQIFAELQDGREQNYLILDCDTIVVRDPLPLLRRDVFHAKVAPLPTVTHEVFERLFAHFGLELPERTCITGYTGTPTIPYFNAGVIAISAALAAQFVPEWRRFNAALAASPELVAPCQKHLHQAALALALAATGVPRVEAGTELNFQLNMTQFRTPAGYPGVDPYIIHYHHLVDAYGLLLPCSFPGTQERIDQFNARLLEERSRSVGLNRHKPVAGSPAKQVTVIGMHRSGTSLVARLLNAMGCYAGEEHDFPVPDVFNPAGYWEHRDVWALDEEILAVLETNWLEPARADLTKLSGEVRAAFVTRAREIAHALDECGSWVVKDPRLAILFPIWREALERPLCVLVSREPSAVARSLTHRDGLPHAVGLALWEEYTRAMLALTVGVPRVIVSYQELLASPVECVTRLHGDLVAAGATDLRLPAGDEVRAMVDPALDRQGSGSEGLLNAPQNELYDALRSGEALQWETVPPIRPETRELLSAWVKQARENAALRKERGELEGLIDEVFSSRSWRSGFAVTRMWRAIVPSRSETAVDRWSRRQRH